MSKTLIFFLSSSFQNYQEYLSLIVICIYAKFNFFQIIVMYLQVLGFQSNQKLMQYSWNYMNDALRTDIFVRYQPETVACACIYLTARKVKIPLPKNPNWFSIFSVTEEEVRDVAIRILKLYNRPKVCIV